jgi:hypothetical protein
MLFFIPRFRRAASFIRGYRRKLRVCAATVVATLAILGVVAGPAVSGVAWLSLGVIGLLSFVGTAVYACVLIFTAPDIPEPVSRPVRVSRRIGRPVNRQLLYQQLHPHRPYQSELDLNEYSKDVGQPTCSPPPPGVSFCTSCGTRATGTYCANCGRRHI